MKEAVIDSEMEQAICNLCGSDSADVTRTIGDYLLDRPDVVTTLVKCRTCGLTYQTPRPTLAAIGQHYPDDYESYNHDIEDKNIWLPLRLAYQVGMRKRRRVVTRHKAIGRLLDVGCSTGNFLRAFQGVAGWEIEGVEISEHASRIAREQFGLKVHTGTLESTAYPTGQFDAVTMWDVLEHVHDPAATVQEIHRILKPDGIFSFRVPNIDSWDAKLFGDYWAGLDAPRHLYVFGRQTLTQLLEQNGFAVKQMNCEIGTYPTFVLSARFWLLGRGASEKTRERITRFLYHPVMRVATLPFGSVYGAFQRGPLLTVTATKRA